MAAPETAPAPQVTERTRLDILKQMVGNYSESHPSRVTACNDAAAEIGKRIKTGVISGNDLKAIRKQLLAIPENTQNPGRDQIMKDMAISLKLPDLLSDIQNFSNGTNGSKVLCIAAAYELARRATVAAENGEVPPEIGTAVEEISNLPSNVNNPGRAIIRSSQLKLKSIKDLVEITTTETDQEKSTEAANELVVRAKEAAALGNELKTAFISIGAIAAQAPTPATDIIISYVRSLTTPEE